jgi:hypothetical protein
MIGTGVAPPTHSRQTILGIALILNAGGYTIFGEPNGGSSWKKLRF